MLSVHYLLPFIVLGCIVAHLVVLHYMGSGSNSTVPGCTVDGDAFIVYYYKDLYVIGCIVLIYVVVVLCYPDTLHHPDNYCYVDRFTTPKHIVPEWYFLPFYSMLRACSVKAIGVLLLATAVLLYALLLLVVVETHNSRSTHSYVEGTMHVALLVILGLLGQCADRKSVV